MHGPISDADNGDDVDNSSRNCSHVVIDDLFKVSAWYWHA